MAVCISSSRTTYVCSHFHLALYDCVNLKVKSRLCAASMETSKEAIWQKLGGPEHIGLQQE